MVTQRSVSDIGKVPIHRSLNIDIARFFAVAQKKYVYIYDHAGVEVKSTLDILPAYQADLSYLKSSTASKSTSK